MPNHSIIHKWYEAYKLIAELLYNFYKENPENPSKKVYDRLKETKFAEINEGRLFHKRLSRISERGLDPIQIFATFNYPKIGRRRIDIINSLLEEFKYDKRVDNTTSFYGCPSPIITAIVQYRGWQPQNQIWEMFVEIMNGGIHGLTDQHFRSLKGWRGLDIASFTMFLFWINSYEFIPMDRNSVEFLRAFDIIDQRPRTYQAYFVLCTQILGSSEDTNVIRNIVKDSYRFANKTSTEDVLSRSTFSIFSKKGKGEKSMEGLEIIAKRKQQERANGFQVIALRPKNYQLNKEQKHIKNLKQGELYQFYHSYKINTKDDRTIVYYPDKDVDLYSQGNLKISICSIVGKNGSGKSTVAEFLYLIINKIAIAKKIKSTEKLVDEEVYADLYVKLDKLYKITVGQTVDFFEYDLEADNMTYRLKNKIGIEKFDVERFCYTIAVNYSLYSLNTIIIGNWIYPLFHKNDSYQVPMVLNPLRDEGNIDVNNEEGLAKSRLLSNILEPELIDFEKKKVPELVPNTTPIDLILYFDRKKYIRKKVDFHNRYGKLQFRQVNNILFAFDIKPSSDREFLKEAKEYIYYKIVTIADRYPKFKDFKRLPEWVSSDAEKLSKYINRLSEDTSHITFKLKQAINYLKYGIYKSGEDNKILSLSEQIRDIKEETGIRTIELVPPSFFKTNLVFKHGGTFNDLSSGEKQQIFSINTITYHIYNIASVMYDEDSYKYHNLNIVFDEVELYFHPEMQRTYISNLLYRISALPLEDRVHNINMIFITHSPFILSDIPSSNILRLTIDSKTKKSLPTTHIEQTFGANIHELLANDFFLEHGFMGQFANDKIQKIINEIESWHGVQPELKDELFKTIQLVGEPLVKESLMDLYREKIGLHESEISIIDIDAEIKRLLELKKKTR
jgi:predicted ATP-binding protein involved in virulence